MFRTLAVAGALLGLGGCSDRGGTSEVPVVRARPEAPPADVGGATRPPRAIATH